MTDATAPAIETQATRPWPAPSTAWFLVVMLTVAYVFSYVDRTILGLLIQPIKADLNLSDKQIGWVLGPAFAVFYATMGVPLGWLVDRQRRTWIIAIGIGLWSLATAASGLARNFTHLFLARMAVGVGEAALSPAAFSIIGDSFPPERRGKPIAFYTMALSLGAGIASLIGAGVIQWAKTAPPIEAPIIGVVAPWQATFFAVGLPGLLAALFFAFAHEPARRIPVSSDLALKGNGLHDALGYLVRHAGAFLGFVSLVCVMTITAYSHGFLAPAFERTWGWPPEKFALINAGLLLAIGPAMVLLTGYLSDRWSQAGTQEAPFRLLLAGFTLMLPTGIAIMLMPTPELASAMLGLNIIGIGIISAVSVTSLLLITPASIRGQIVALYYVVISLSGLLLGPTTVGWLSTDVFGENNIRYAIAIVPAMYGILPALLIPLTHKHYLAQMRRVGSAST